MSEKRWQQKVLLGILNSSLANFFYRVLTSDKFEYQRIILDNIREIPVAQEWRKANLIADYVDRIFDKQAPPNKNEVERKIDILVYLIYNLDWNDIKVIEESTVATLPCDETTYNCWLNQYKNDGTLPTEADMN